MENICNVEPDFACPCCSNLLHTDWADNGFGPYSVQASPYRCDTCGWSETGCETCIGEKCFSWTGCRGRALIIKDIPGEKHTLEYIKRRAKKLKKELPVTHTEALEIIARSAGYANYKDALSSLRDTGVHPL